MDLIVNSLYSNKEHDALDKLRFLSVTQPELLKDVLVHFDIRIQADKDNGIITIIDTAKFLKALKDSKDSGGDSNLIGQFGVGFYSAFLVSEKSLLKVPSRTSNTCGKGKQILAPILFEKKLIQKSSFNEYFDPLASSHFTTEGEVEFRSILYVPAVTPMGKDDIANPKTKNIRLYVKRVFISDDFDGELFLRYLSFVKGVVDSNDLPLNVSWEVLQESRIVRIMRKRLVRKAFDMILGISLSENREDY
ncbi:hypothetical protein MLD38_029245 [Melastoma candidum]|uniref:Uncharacterized protein n=1 Tax=Melastoma candidum TaxID=119954 RepID=A0ACB9N5N1_9MYRT|nr:hypothetical protein MLD38_029245 [Melastoma candidum]